MTERTYNDSEPNAPLNHIWYIYALVGAIACLSGYMFIAWTQFHFDLSFEQWCIGAMTIPIGAGLMVWIMGVSR